MGTLFRSYQQGRFRRDPLSVARNGPGTGSYPRLPGARSPRIRSRRSSVSNRRRLSASTLLNVACPPHARVSLLAFLSLLRLIQGAFLFTACLSARKLRQPTIRSYTCKVNLQV